MEKTIGIVGGAGPFAGLDLLKKILEQTAAETDQDHLNVIGIFKSSEIGDRTAYLFDPTLPNPGVAIARQALELEKMGAGVAAIPCNTAHSAPIVDMVLETLEYQGSKLLFSNMIRETVDFLRLHYPEVNKVGVLSTTGTQRSGVYAGYLNGAGLQDLNPDAGGQEAVHQAIYDRHYGIKAAGRATEQARNDLLAAAGELVRRGAGAVILGCTEIPLAIHEDRIGPAVVVDPTLILARALIRQAAPEKLKPITN
ncbi:MAG: aspartate/glutamate racemase family protein [Anaerolineales bacterium]|nr:aspartate/glutamate racemase family protein [Anaerolineales bacterium]